VVRTIKFNSHQGESDGSGADVKKQPKDSGVGLVKDALRAFEKRHQSQTELKVHELELAQARDRREAEAEARWLEIEAEECKLKLCKQYEEWSNSSNLLLQRKAQKLGRELAAEEGLEFD